MAIRIIRLLSLQIDKKSNRSKENLTQLNDILHNLEQSEFVDHGLALYKVSKIEASVFIKPLTELK